MRKLRVLRRKRLGGNYIRRVPNAVLRAYADKVISRQSGCANAVGQVLFAVPQAFFLARLHYCDIIIR